MPPASFLHGVEVFEFDLGPVPIQVVNSAVIGLVGSAPLFAVPGALPLWSPSWLVQDTPQWNFSQAYKVGDTVADSNGNTQKCTTAGTSGTFPPMWRRSVGATTPDGTAVWTLMAVGVFAGTQCIDANGAVQMAVSINTTNWAAATAYTVGQLVVDSNGNMQRCMVAGTSAAAHPVWSVTLGGVTADGAGALSWTMIAAGEAAITGTVAPTWGTTVGSFTTDGQITWQLQSLASPNINTPVLVAGGNAQSLSPGQAGVFGPMILGFTIPYALNQMFEQGAGQAIVVNVFDQSKHHSTLSNYPYAFPTSGVQAIVVGLMGIGGVKVTNTGGTVTYVQGADFKVDLVNGIITAIGGGRLTVGQTVNVTCFYADPSKIADADLIGAVTSGVYTGMQAWLLSFTQMGFFPKLLIAPASAPVWFTAQTAGSGDATVAAAMAALAQTMRAMYFVDCPPGTLAATLLSNRGTVGNAFNTSDKRAILLGPQLLFEDNGIVPGTVTIDPVTGRVVQSAAGTVHSGAYSPWAAGTTAAKDLAQGYWWSPSNTQINGPLGPDVNLYSSLDASSDANQLNAAGIVTVSSVFASGLRLWGNRSAGFPTYTTPDVFIAVRRTMDVIEQSVQLTMMQFLDQPITNALVTTILASTNAFLRTLIGRGALINGSCSYDPIDNPASQVANGQLVFSIDCMPPIPAERLTFNVFIDTSLLSQITGPVNATPATVAA